VQKNGDDEVGEKGGAGGVLRASGADADGLKNRDKKYSDGGSGIGQIAG
jgi:hypothetical protein